jgi:hypothetical protein
VLLIYLSGHPVVGVGEVQAGGGYVGELLTRTWRGLGDVVNLQDPGAAAAGDLHGTHDRRSGRDPGRRRRRRRRPLQRADPDRADAVAAGQHEVSSHRRSLGIGCGAAKYRRLAALKAEWDPDNVFRYNANIVPDGAAAPPPVPQPRETAEEAPAREPTS